MASPNGTKPHCLEFTLKVYKKIQTLSMIVVAGVALGMALAEVDVGSSARAVSLQLGSKIGGQVKGTPHSENTKKIEKYWQETHLGLQEVRSFISNDKCRSSEKYFAACLNAMITNALAYNLKLSLDNGQLVKLDSSERLDEKSEKELLLSYLKQIEETQCFSFFTGRRRDFCTDFESIMAKLIDLEHESKRPMLAAQMINAFMSVYFDPHTYILPANFYDEVGSKIERSKFFVGISYEKVDGIFHIRKVFKNSDAEIAGLKADDKILSINSIVLNATKNENQNRDISNILKNESLDLLKFKIARKNKILDIDVKRSYKKLSHVQYNALSAAPNYGLLTLTKFNPGVCAEIANKLQSIKSSSLAGLILDLRDNPGGQLNEAACIAGLFLGKNKKAYYVEYFDEAKANEVVLTSQEQVYTGPLIVVVNRTSASATELLAGGLQDYKRAVIIGERTFGKGTFQEPEEWALNTKVSLLKTRGLYLLPNRDSTQLRGVAPDVELPVVGGPTERESEIYFNPVVAPAAYVEARKYESARCKNITNFNRFNSDDFADDLYLQESLTYLSCIEASAAAVAQTKLGSGN